MPWLRSLAALLLLGATTFAADWPQWLGPRRDGGTPETVAPWKGDLKTLWSKPVGEGHSSPVVAGGVVYLHTKDTKADAEVLHAWDAATGKELWQKSYPRPAYRGFFGNGPRATPAVVGGKVFTHGITGLLTCFDAKSGNQVWQVDTQARFQAPKLFFGSSCSPLAEGDRVLLNVGGKGSSVVAFAAGSGDVLWKALDTGASYASGIIIGDGNNRQAVFLTKDGLVSVALADGQLRWQFPFRDALAESSTTPVRVGGLLVGSAITLGSVALKLDADAAQPAPEKVWLKPELTCYFATPVPAGDHLYMVTGTKPPAIVTKATLHCVEPATGKVLWSRPDVGKYHASLLRTGDGKLLMLEEKGDLVLIEPGPQGYRELARASVCGNTWAHAAVSDGRLFIRDGRELHCVELPK